MSMGIQFGSVGSAANMQASFLRGGIAARHLPSADVTFSMGRGNAYLPQAPVNSTTFECSNNPHIPACRIPTDGCTTGLPTDNTCATDLQICNTITQTANCATIVNCS